MRNFLPWLGRHWYRGFRKSSTTNDFIWYILPFVFCITIPINEWFVFPLLFIYLLGAIPILVSWGIPTHSDPEEWLRRQSEWFETIVLQWADKVGIVWQGHLATRIDLLLADGRRIEAVKLYR